jgi:hypothetical protein
MSPEAFENSHKCNRLLDYIYETIRTSSVQPDEFLAAFQNSRRIALSQTFPLHLYLQRLKEALDKGVSPEEICKYLLSTTSTKRSIHSAHTVASNSSNATGNDYLEELLKKEPGF